MTLIISVPNLSPTPAWASKLLGCTLLPAQLWGFPQGPDERENPFIAFRARKSFRCFQSSELKSLDTRSLRLRQHGNLA